MAPVRVPIHPPKPRLSKKTKPKPTQEQKLQKRDFLVDCILHDEIPSRSTTPVRLLSAKGGRSNSRSASLTPRPDIDNVLRTPLPSQPSTPRKRERNNVHAMGAVAPPVEKTFQSGAHNIFFDHR